MNMNRLSIGLFVAATLATIGCATQTHRFVDGEDRETVAGFAEAVINSVISRAVQSLYSLDRIKLQAGANRAVVIVEDVEVDTSSRGCDTEPLAEELGQLLREELTNGRKVVVYNREVAQYATVKVDPQYILRGKLTQRNLRQDNGDVQIEYVLNLTFADIQTGLEYWQKSVTLGKLADKRNLM